MKPMSRIYLTDEQNIKFFGDGPYRLLKAVEDRGSLRAAAISMGMAYTKALKIIKQAETALNFPLICSTKGGKHGGGSVVTHKGKELMHRYQTYRSQCIKSNNENFASVFNKIGCIIMASGLGIRFGTNKLMTEFYGKPMISWILDATDNLFYKRVVVTRHKDVENLCLTKNIPVLMHDMPYQNDTIRLGLEEIISQTDDSQSAELNGCMFCTADQPLLSVQTLKNMISEFTLSRGCIIRAAYDGKCGNPVIFPRWAFENLMNLPQDRGGNVIIKNHPNKVIPVQTQYPWELQDIDTRDDIKNIFYSCR